jgi:starch phosphorylase
VEEKLDRDNAPVKRVLGRDGTQLILQVPFIAPQIHFALWRVDIGRVILYLIDTEIEQNPPHLRNISSRLYSSVNEMRLLQEVVLGIGGTHALKSLGVKYSAIHLNEGHAAFALIERYRQKIEEGLSPKEALQHVYSTSLFTTHTPVPAGHDRFPNWMIDKYLNAYYAGMHMSREEFLQKGHHIEDPPDTFNMAAFCLRMCAHGNGVSQKHGEVARRMWHFLWPENKLDEVPIGSVTNGVHIPTWINPRLVSLINRYISPICPDWFEHHDKEYVWALIDQVPDAKLWDLHYALKIKLINRILQFKRRDWMKYQADCANVVAGGALIDPNTLTIGFARRFSTYKRADLIFQDLDRLKKILNNPWKPVQIIFAGKAHPADDEGKRILQRIYQYAQQPEFGGRIAFVEDYGEQIAKYLVQGVDVWMNNPVPPLEASGTSGMKAAVNGVLNFSIADGWWIEGYNGKNGWIFGRDHANGDRNWEDASEMYSLLENEIVPLYYDTGLDGIPHKWVAMMKESIKSNAPRFSSRRMVKEYMHKYYISTLSCVECNAFIDDNAIEAVSQ